jgi:hypothetical protein
MKKVNEAFSFLPLVNKDLAFHEINALLREFTYIVFKLIALTEA